MEKPRDALIAVGMEERPEAVAGLRELRHQLLLLRSHDWRYGAWRWAAHRGLGAENPSPLRRGASWRRAQVLLQRAARRRLREEGRWLALSCRRCCLRAHALVHVARRGGEEEGEERAVLGSGRSEKKIKPERNIQKYYQSITQSQ